MKGGATSDSSVFRWCRFSRAILCTTVSRLTSPYFSLGSLGMINILRFAISLRRFSKSPPSRGNLLNLRGEMAKRRINVLQK